MIYFLRIKNRLKAGVRFFKDRYHLAIKKTPAEVKKVVSYILFNTVKHTGKLDYDVDYTFSYKRNDFLDPPQFWLSRQAFIN